MADKTRPKLLFTLQNSPNRFGGIESFCTELARQLDARGWDLVICYLASPPESVREFLLAPGNVSLDVMTDQTGMSLDNARRFLALLRKHQPEVMLYSLGGVVRWWPALAKMTGVRRTVYRDATSRTAKSIGYKAGAKVKLVMRALDCVVCATAFVKACSDREEIIPAKKSVVIYNGIDNERPLGDGMVFRQKWGIPPSAIVVLDISWLVPDKGIDVALRAAARALQAEPKLHFCFSGDGAHRAEYVALAQELGIAEHVTWTGAIENLAASGAFRAADMQIQVSQWHEAFCLAVAEGMSAGLPQIAAKIGGLPELVQDGVNGFLFEPPDEEALAGAIVKLAADEDLRLRMGIEGRKKALEKFDVKHNVERWVEVLLG